MPQIESTGTLSMNYILWMSHQLQKYKWISRPLFSNTLHSKEQMQQCTSSHNSQMNVHKLNGPAKQEAYKGESIVGRRLHTVVLRKLHCRSWQQLDTKQPKWVKQEWSKKTLPVAYGIRSTSKKGHQGKKTMTGRNRVWRYHNTEMQFTTQFTRCKVFTSNSKGFQTQRSAKNSWLLVICSVLIKSPIM